MIEQDNNQPLLPPEPTVRIVPWTLLDSWIAVGLLIILNIGLLVSAALFPLDELFQSAGILFVQLIYLLPIVIILGLKRISWRHLGFGKFEPGIIGIGCGLITAAYVFIILHNAILMALGVDTQGEEVLKVFAELDSPVWFIIVGVVFAPIVEEIFFRGFLFQGFRQRYGWTGGIVISSLIFAAAHFDPVAFIPTFILGAVLAYIYHSSNSVWPGIILHLINNGFSFCALLAATHIPDMIPS